MLEKMKEEVKQYDVDRAIIFSSKKSESLEAISKDERAYVVYVGSDEKNSYFMPVSGSIMAGLAYLDRGHLKKNTKK